MIVLGRVISAAQQAACHERMLCGDPFTSFDIERAASAAGVVNGRAHPVAYRLADRMIQYARKDGIIIREGRWWRRKK